MSNIFDQENECVTEREMMEEIESEEVNQDYDLSVLNQYNQESEEDINDQVEQEEQVQSFSRPPLNKKVAFNLSEQEQSTMNSATVRLEQARLYEMLMKHDLFATVQANSAAINNVKKELKAFLLEKLQILLGIRSQKVETETVEVYSQFNDVEVDFLKALSLSGTKGQSTNGEAFLLQTNKRKTISKEEVVEPDYGSITPIEQEPRQEPRQVQKTPRRVQQRLPTKQVAQPTKQVAQPTKQIQKQVQKQVQQRPQPTKQIQKPSNYDQSDKVDNMPDDIITYHAKKEIERQKKLGKISSRGNIYDNIDEDVAKERLKRSKPRRAVNASAIQIDNDMANALIQSNGMKAATNDIGLNTILNVLARAKK